MERTDPLSAALHYLKRFDSGAEELVSALDLDTFKTLKAAVERRGRELTKELRAAKNKRKRARKKLREEFWQHTNRCPDCRTLDDPSRPWAAWVPDPDVFCIEGMSIINMLNNT